MTATITRMNPPTLPDAGAIGYSQISVMEPGRMAFVSGQVAIRAGEAVPEDVAEQARVAASNCVAALEALGAGVADIAMLRVFMVDLTPETLDRAFPAVLEMLDGVQPSLTGVGVAALAEPELKIELEMVVRLPD